MMHITRLQDSVKVFDALGSDTRIRILEMIMSNREFNLDQFAKELGISNSAVTMHVRKLQEAGIIQVATASGKRGSKKICTLAEDKLLVEFLNDVTPAEIYTVELGIGYFNNYEVAPTCGLATAEGIIGEFDEPRYFNFPDRYNAAILWFSSGYLEYRLPNSLKPGEIIKELQITFEIASEAPGFSTYYPSDIHFAVNGTPLGFWTSPGEYNDRRGNFTPSWWFGNLGQYGRKKMLAVNGKGTFMDGFLLSDVTIDKLGITYNSEISFIISAPKDAKNAGGLTLFGKGFGDYNQGVSVSILYERPKK